MSNDYIQFPRGAKRFFLRGDLATEFCFPEYACCPAVRPGILEAAREGRPLPNPFPDDGYVDLSTYEPGRFFAYDSVGCKGTILRRPAMSDGQIWMPVERNGLYEALLQAAEKAYGKPIVPLLFPPPPTAPFSDWIGDATTPSCTTPWPSPRPSCRGKRSPTT